MILMIVIVRKEGRLHLLLAAGALVAGTLAADMQERYYFLGRTL